MRAIAACVLTGAVLATAGCGYLPAAGPRSWDIRSHTQEAGSLPYALVKMTPEVVHVLAETEPMSIAMAFTNSRPPPTIKFGIGDVVSVTVFEAAAGGLHADE
jgi:polysaccharide export outer membrane protein